MRYSFLVFLSFIVASPVAIAGCPRLPDEQISIKINSCYFYEAKEDSALKTKINEYYSEGFNGFSIERLEGVRNDVLLNNTGAIIYGGREGDIEDIKYFYRSVDKETCNQFQIGHIYQFNLNYTCPMVYFEAPAKRVISLEIRSEKTR